MMARSASGKLLVISSPSGGGKTTVVRELLKEVPALIRSVSVTTRPRRAAERDGADYRFVSRPAFERLRARDKLLEWAKVHQAYYGTPKGPVQRAVARGQDVILSLDVQGARQIRRRFGTKAVLVFLVPPSLQDLKTRLLKRRTETPASIRQRVRAARRELARLPSYDYAVVNRDVRQAVDDLKSIVIAERLRVRTNQRRSHDQNAD